MLSLSKKPLFQEAFRKGAVRTRLERATSCVTGRSSNHLNYRPCLPSFPCNGMQKLTIYQH